MTPESAKVTSIDALDSFKASLIVYLDQAGGILDGINDDVVRTRVWLETDRQPHWKKLVHQRTKELAHAEQELMTARLSDLPETVKARRMAVTKAKLALHEAEEGLVRVKHWIRGYETQAGSRLKLVTKLRNLLESDMRKAVAFLEGAAASLADYAEMTPPPSASPVASVAGDDGVLTSERPQTMPEA